MRGLEYFLQTFEDASLLLDLYPADAAYSLRKLRTAYTGSAIRVRRSSDNVQQDIGFVDNELDTASLLSFVGANDGFIRTWYDQSGNSNHLESTITGQQPKIVSLGVLNVFNGLPYLSYSGNNGGGLKTISIGISSVNSSCFSVYNSNDANAGMILSSSDSLLNFIGVMENGSTSASQLNSGSPNYYKNSTIIIDANRNLLYDNYTVNDDVLISILQIDFSNSDWLNSIQPFTYNQSDFSQNNKFKEFIIYNSDQTINKSNIESNINAHYNIY